MEKLNETLNRVDVTQTAPKESGHGDHAMRKAFSSAEVRDTERDEADPARHLGAQASCPSHVNARRPRSASAKSRKEGPRSAE